MIKPEKLRAWLDLFDTMARHSDNAEAKAFSRELRRKYMPRILRAERELAAQQNIGRGDFAELVAAINRKTNGKTPRAHA